MVVFFYSSLFTITIKTVFKLQFIQYAFPHNFISFHGKILNENEHIQGVPKSTHPFVFGITFDRVNIFYSNLHSKN